MDSSSPSGELKVRFIRVVEPRHSRQITPKIPKALREQIWLRDMGHSFQGKCKTRWCRNTITVFDYHCGHDIPSSKGGATSLDNLHSICARCNVSMSNQYTFSQWNMLQPRWSCVSCVAVEPCAPLACAPLACAPRAPCVAVEPLPSAPPLPNGRLRSTLVTVSSNSTTA